MGLKTRFKGLLLSDKKGISTSPSPSPSTAGTDKNDSITTVLSSHALQPGDQSSDASLTTEYSTPWDLWDEAYTIFSRERPKLKDRYEEILLTQEERNGEPTQNHLRKSKIILPWTLMADAVVI
jgi:hypothetical protein